jgi:hypothetical protein
MTEAISPMKQRGQGVRVHAEVILVDIGAWFAIALCSFSVANRILRYKRRYILKTKAT